MTHPDHPYSADQVRSLFDRIAPVYDGLNQWLSLGQHRIWKQMAVIWSMAKPGDTSLDVCCGSGDLAHLLAKQVGRSGHVIGVDFSGEQLTVARQRSAAKGLTTGITWVEADALQLPLPDNHVDAATMGYGLRNVVNIPACFQELYRVLKPGAKAAILDFNHTTDQWVSGFQRWYLATIVVPIAQQVGLKDDYAYLMPSLERFPTGEAQCILAQQAGFRESRHYPIAGGTMGILVITK